MDKVNNGLYRYSFNHNIVKCMRTRRKFKVDFLENKASNEKSLFHNLRLIFSCIITAPGCTINTGTPCMQKKKQVRHRAKLEP